MRLRKDLVDELIRVTKEYYKKRDISLIEKIKLAGRDLIIECGTFYSVHIADLIEDLAKFSVFAKKETDEDIYKTLEIFGVIVE